MRRASGGTGWTAVMLVVTLVLAGSLGHSSEPAEGTGAGELNDELWVEVKAHLNYEIGLVTEKYSPTSGSPEEARKSVEAIDAARTTVYERYEVTGEALDAYYEAVVNEDIQRAMELTARVNRLTEQLRQSAPEAEPSQGAGHVEHLPGVPVLPGSQYDPESTEQTIWYTTDLGEEEALSFYRSKLTDAGWTCNPTEFSLYFIKGDRAFELSMPGGESPLQYRTLSAETAVCESVVLSEDEYIAKVVLFSEKLFPYHQAIAASMSDYQSNPCDQTMGAVDEAEAKLERAVIDVAPVVGVSLMRLTDFTDEHAIALMRYLVDHPDLKNRGVPTFLSGQLGYWDVLSTAVDRYVAQHPEDSQAIEQDVRTLAEDFMVY